MNNSIKSSWQAVSIVPGPGACEAAQQRRQERYLARNAPRLPLSDCTNQDRCQCKYQRYSDRRAGPRRAEDQPAGNRSPAPARERRRPGERRERR
jgi:hypothetical protein